MSSTQKQPALEPEPSLWPAIPSGDAVSVIYALLSPTFGMHQYTADLANRQGGSQGQRQVHVVTTTRAPRDRYGPAVQVHTPLSMGSTGFRPEGLDLGGLRRVEAAITSLAARELPASATGAPGQVPVIHFTGVHLWNPLLMRSLRRRGYPVVHTLHDLDPHLGVRHGILIRQWNRLVVAAADHLLVHGQVYRRRLLAQGVAPERVTATPLLHLFLSHDALVGLEDEPITYEPWALFFGRLEAYKGVSQLLQAAAREPAIRIVVAGSGDLRQLWQGPLPPGVELRQRRVEDAEAVDLFRRCGLVVLPYLDATQSALVAAAYFFRKPVVVTRSGALPEYVQEGQTGWVVPPGDVDALASTLAAALADPQRLQEMGLAGRAWYEAQRQQERKDLAALYGRLARPGTK